MVAHDRATALSIQLTLTHRALRDRLRTLRHQLLRGSPRDLLSGSASPAAVLEHCAGFCTALERHHTGEDEGLFPVLRREFPELAPTIDKLAGSAPRSTRSGRPGARSVPIGGRHPAQRESLSDICRAGGMEGRYIRWHGGKAGWGRGETVGDLVAACSW